MQTPVIQRLFTHIGHIFKIRGDYISAREYMLCALTPFTFSNNPEHWNLQLCQSNEYEIRLNHCRNAH
jgi:hypothetical protein